MIESRIEKLESKVAEQGSLIALLEAHVDNIHNMLEGLFNGCSAVMQADTKAFNEIGETFKIMGGNIGGLIKMDELLLKRVQLMEDIVRVIGRSN